MEKKQITPEIEGSIKSAMDEHLGRQLWQYPWTVKQTGWGHGLRAA